MHLTLYIKHDIPTMQMGQTNLLQENQEELTFAMAEQFSVCTCAGSTPSLQSSPSPSPDCILVCFGRHICKSIKTICSYVLIKTQPGVILRAI